MRATAVQFENGFLHEISTQGHCKSFILQRNSWLAYSRVSTDSLICDVSEEVATEIAENGCRRRPRRHLGF